MLLIAAALAVCAPGPRDNCVHDGDTVWLGGEKLRIADIDTPELNGRCELERPGFELEWSGFELERSASSNGEIAHFA